MGIKAFNKSGTIVERHLAPHLRYANQGGYGVLYDITQTEGVIVAGEDLNEGEAFYIGSDGLAYKSSNIDGNPAIGIVTQSGSLNSQLPYIDAAEYTHSTYTFTPGGIVWLADGAPNLSTDLPSFERHYLIQRLGVAKTANTFLLDIGDEYIVE